MIPNLVSGNPTIAVDAKTRRSVANASSSPPPSASDATAAMVGMGRVSMASKVERSLVRKSWVLWMDVSYTILPTGI
jgi:hypothetical protein